jgi:Ca2+-binding RTX toxin-like protein
VLVKLAGGGIALLALVALLAPSAEGRGGNHGCSSFDGSFYESHFHASGDNVVAGLADVEPSPGPRLKARGITGGSAEERVKTANTGSAGEGTEAQSCSSTTDRFWELFRSALGPGDDSVRMDARGLDDKDDFDPLPRRVASEVTGGGGADVIRGHVGFDDMSGDGGADRLIPGAGADRVLGGAGPDVIKAAGGGGDNVQCGAGRDKAVVDERDETSGCERLIVR